MLTFISSHRGGNGTWVDHQTGRIGVENDEGDVAWYEARGTEMVAVSAPVEPTEAMYQLLRAVAGDAVGGGRLSRLRC